MRYFLDSDDDGHWYIIQAHHRPEWVLWRNLDPDNPEAWKTPPFADRLNGHPDQIEFGSDWGPK